MRSVHAAWPARVVLTAAELLCCKALCIFGLMPSTPGPQRKSLTWLESECAEVSKYVEFGDTFLLILKSGQRQSVASDPSLCFQAFLPIVGSARSKDFGLHLYHHALVPALFST